jgi:hypothetical protein
MAADDLNKEQLEEWFRLHEERRALQRQAADLEKQADRIEPKIWAFIKKHGGRNRALSKWGFNLAVKLVKASVSWKAEFLAIAGPEKAAEVAAAVGTRESLSVELVAR